MKKSILSLTALLICGALFAQEDNKNAVVSVENDYNPTVVTVNKKNFTPTVEGKSNAEPAELIFSKQATPYTGFTSERNSLDILPQQDKALPGYLRVGYGIRNDIDAKLAYNIDLGKKSFLRVLGAFDGFKSNVASIYFPEWNSRLYNTAAALDFGYKFKKLTFGITGDFNNLVLNYQKANEKVGSSNRQHHINYNVGINGVSQLAGPLAYTFKAGYTSSLVSYIDGVENPIAENHINAGATFAYEVYTKYMRRAGIDVDFNGFLYNGTLSNNGYNNFLSMDFTPYADFNFNDWKMTFGVNLNFRAGDGPVLAAAPHITVDKALTKRISFYANVTGGRKDNSFKTIEGITPYWGCNSNESKQLNPTYRIVDILAGTRMTLEPLYFDIFAGYVLTKDDLLQTIEYSGTMPTFIYSNFGQEFTNNVHAGARIGYDYGGWLNIEADAKYDYWTCKDKNLLVLRPEVTANAKVEVRPIKNLTMRVGYNFTRYTKKEDGTRLNDKHDLHARIGYSINKYFGAFIQGDNLLNAKYFEYAGYYTRGIRGMLGVTVNF